MKTKLRSHLLSLAFVLGTAACLFCQAVSARLEGTVFDPSKAVVAKAVVTATNQDTGATTSVTSSETGGYVFPNILPGRYTVAVEVPGFKRLESRDLVLQIGDARRLDLNLQQGTVTESVDVVSEVPSVDTATTKIGAVVDNRQAVDLPLNGRDAMQLIFLQAGTNPIDRFGSQQQNGVVDGLPPNSSEIKVEGVLSINPGYDYSVSHPSMPVPQEAVGEYRVSTSGELSDSGKGSGAQVKVLIKSGTNSFHGSAFEFNRNTDYNANDFFSNRQGNTRPVLLRNQFGFSIGGPIRKNKTFFFATSEWQRQTQASVENRMVYTPTLRSGIFRYNRAGANSSSLVDQSGNLLVPASQIGTINLTTIDPSRTGFDTVFLPKILSVMPAPNNFDLGDGLNTGGYRYNAPVPDNYYQFLIKVDHELTQKHHLAVSVSQYFENNPNAATYNGISLEGFTEFRRGATARLISTFTPTLTNELSVGANLRLAQRPNTNPAQQTPSGNFQLIGLGTGSVLTGGTNGNINSLRSNQVNPAFTEGFQDNATKVWAKHTVSFGGEFWHQTLNRQTQAGEYPVISTVNANNPASVPALAGLNSVDRANAQQFVNDLTGTVGTITQNFWLTSPNGFVPYSNLYQAMRKNEWGLFVQDLWKIRPNLTLNVGLRYDVLPPVTINNVYAYPIGGLAGALGIQGPTGQPTRWGQAGDNGGDVFRTRYNNFAPSIGLVWDPFGDGKTSIRSSYRVAYDRTMMVSGDFSSTNYGTNTSVTLTPNIRFSQLGSVLPIATPPVFPSLGNVRQGSAYVADPDLDVPYVQSWSFGIQRELFKDWTVSANYVGNHAVGMWQGTNLNQVNIGSNGFLNAFQVAQRNLATNGSPVVGQNLGALQSLFRLVPSSQYNLITQGQAASLANYLDTNTATTGQRGGLVTLAGLPATFFRYNPQVQDLYVVGNWAQSTWNGLKLEVQRRMSHGVYLQANYTFSKGLTNAPYDIQQFTTTFRDGSNHALDKGLSPLDSTHVVLINGVYELPFGRGKSFLANAGTIVNGIAGGWQVNGIFNFSTGHPVQITTGRYTLNQNVASTPNFAGGFTNLTDVYKGGNQVTFITPAEAAAFSNPLAGQAGGLPALQFHGPGFSTLDASLFKSFGFDGIHEGLRAQLRFEFFNVLNHASFQAPNSTSINSGTLGVLTSAFPARVGQIALKIIF